MEWNLNEWRNRDRAGIGDQAHLGQLCQCVELGKAVRAVVDAGVLVYGLERGVRPDLVLHDGAAQGGHIILPGEGLLRLGRGVVDGKPRVQCGRAFEESEVAMPEIGAALGAEY